MLRAGEPKRGNTRDGENETQVKERKNKKSVEKRKEGKERKQLNYLATRSEIKNALYEKKPIIVLVYKEALINTNELNSSVPSVVVALLQDYGDLFPKETPGGLPPIKGIKC